MMQRRGTSAAIAGGGYDGQAGDRRGPRLLARRVLRPVRVGDVRFGSKAAVLSPDPRALWVDNGRSVARCVGGGLYPSSASTRRARSGRSVTSASTPSGSA